MRFRTVLLAAGRLGLAGMLAASLAMSAGAAEKGGIAEALKELLDGGSGGAATPAPEPDAAIAPATPAPAPATAGPDRRVPFSRNEMQLSFAPLVKAAAPAVVNVYASSTRQVRSPFAGDPFFEQFFGGNPAPRVQSSLGSGVLVDPSGLVVTNFHVIRDADEVKVALADGREFESRTILKDESLDLAVLKIESRTPFPVMPIGDSDALEIGDLVLAIGDPFGVGQTTTSGIVSALARNNVGVSDFGFFIQTDAAINPGNSGGALIDMNGRLAGINTAIFSQSGGSNGIGFAIPSNMVRALVESAKQGNDFFERPYVGASFELVTPQVAEALGMDHPVGALVSGVDAGGPAEKAGLKAGDVVTAMNGGAIEHVDALGYRLAVQPVGAVAHLTVLRAGKERTLDVTLIRAPEGVSQAPVEISGDSPFAGARVAILSPRLSQKLRLPEGTRGVAMVDVKQGSPASEIGFQPADIVREVNGAAIDTPEALKAAAAKSTRTWRFTIERGGRLIRQVMRF